MSKDLTKAITLVLMAVLIGIMACGGEVPQQKRQESKLEKMTPKGEDKLPTLMERAWENYTYMLYGLMNYDVHKVKVAAANIVAMSPYMAQNITPQYRKHRNEWNEQCNQLRDLAANLSRHSEEQNFTEARKALEGLFGVCMDCHKVARGHLLKSE